MRVPEGEFCDTDLPLRIHAPKYVPHVVVNLVSGGDFGPTTEALSRPKSPNQPRRTESERSWQD
jgi:hypothetical protein